MSAMKDRVIRGALSLLATSVAWGVSAAEITKERYKETNLYTIIISGEIVPTDINNFINVSNNVPSAIVVLDSPGGNLYAGIQIGRLIKKFSYATFVPSGTLCASSCALTWLAGKPRYADESSFIGFHAAYINNRGVKTESGSGNALLGAYLNDLGLSDAAIVYVTNAPPEGIERLTKSNGDRVGIPYVSLGASRIAKATKTDFGLKTKDTPVSVATSFYQALSNADGELAASYVIPEKRGIGPFNEKNISNFYGNMRVPLRVSSIKQTSSDTVEVEYRYQYSRNVCEGKATLTLVEYLGRILISKIKATC